MKLTKRDVGLLLIVAGVLICLGCYRFVYMKNVDEQAKLKSQLKTIQTEEQGLAELQANRSFYESEIERMNAEDQEILAKFPVDILPENEIMYVVDMEEENDISFSDISYGTASERSTGYESRTGLQAYDVEMSLSYLSTYQGLKDVILYTGGQDRRMVINTVTASFDRSTGNLSGAMTLNQYLITGTDAVYNPPYVPAMSIGTDNIFGTIEIPVTTTQSEETEETEESTDGADAQE